MSERGRPDTLLLGATLVLVVFGLVMVHSASLVFAADHGRDGNYFFLRQALRAAIGLAALLGAYKLGLERLWRAAPIALLGGLLLLFWLLMPWMRGDDVRGTFRWLKLFGMTLQPSEIVKLALLLHLSRLLARRGERVATFEGLFAPLVLLLMVAGLVALQPNLGTAAAIALTGLGLFFLAGARIQHLALISVGLMGLAGVRLLQVPYERVRLLSFLSRNAHPQGAGYQLDQSLIAFGSGGFFGRGIGDGLQKFRFLPDSHTDFIFAIIGEEGGIVMAALVLGVYVLLVSRAMAVSAALHDRFGALVAGGIGLMLAIHVLLNAAVVLGLMPTTGLPLPFLSYGGSSLVINLAAVGILLRLSAERVPVAHSRAEQAAPVHA
jgi:cell division protein FtsW